MAIDPTVLLLDEPFGALDAKVRVELRRWLRQLHDETGFTTVFVTHDQEEALELADRVVVMHQGRIEQDASPAAVYSEPASAFVFDFLGRSNQIEGQVRLGQFQAPGLEGALHAPDVADGPATLFIRPHDLTVAAPGTATGALGPGCIHARVIAVRELAGRLTVEAEVPGQSRAVLLDIAGSAGPVPERGASLVMAPLRFRVFPAV